MRLTEAHRTAIRTIAAETFGAGTSVWLLGSRVDDTKRGGDIDLLIEAKQNDVEEIVRANSLSDQATNETGRAKKRCTTGLSLA